MQLNGNGKMKAWTRTSESEKKTKREMGAGYSGKECAKAVLLRQKIVCVCAAPLLGGFRRAVAECEVPSMNCIAKCTAG